MAKPALFFDIDGVLAFQPEGDILAVNARFGSSWLVADATRFPFASMLPVVQASWLHANRAQVCANLAPDTIAASVVRKAVKAGYDVTIATERHPALHDLTAAWLAYWDIPYGALEVVGPGGKDALLEPYGKGDPCLLVDDSPLNARLAQPGTDVWQPARPYNDGGDGVTRFGDWRDLKKALGL